MNILGNIGLDFHTLFSKECILFIVFVYLFIYLIIYSIFDTFSAILQLELTHWAGHSLVQSQH